MRREGGGERGTGKPFLTSTCPRVTVTGDLWWHKTDTALEPDASTQTSADKIVGEGLFYQGWGDSDTVTGKVVRCWLVRD